ncbi:class I SAM-dependent methyltransferase [Tabrizicola sp. BL-A-41-H6]|uniref:class I SAM-dependent methyltransferase n=1 Tax=Tabrizicola sp. BL-A-41-H6 TaxID=3421107 RepID=UPI003D6671F1
MPIHSYFRDFLTRTDDRTLFKMDHYLDVYDRLLSGWQGRSVSFLEIGVYKGGSLRMWRNFFAPTARLTFVDIDPACKALELPGTEVRIGDQADPAFLAELAAARGPFDMIVDDGGHQMHQQIASFVALWPHLADGGLYIVEDTHTSYWPGFGGGLNTPGSFIAFAKGLIDRMHSWYTEDDEAFPLHPMARELGMVQFHDSLVVIEKRLKPAPVSITSRHGRVERSSRILEIRGRKSIF